MQGSARPTTLHTIQTATWSRTMWRNQPLQRSSVAGVIGEDHADVRELDRPPADGAGDRADPGPHAPALVAGVVREQGVGQSARPGDRRERRQQGPVDVGEAAMPPPVPQQADSLEALIGDPRTDRARRIGRGDVFQPC